MRKLHNEERHIVTPRQLPSGDHIVEDEVCRRRETHAMKETYLQISVGKLERRRPFARPRCRAACSSYGGQERCIPGFGGET